MKKLSLKQKNTIFTVITIIALLLLAGGSYLLFIFLRLAVAFTDPDALLIESNVGYYWIFPIMIFFMGSAAYVVNRLRYDDLPLPAFKPEIKEGIRFPIGQKEHIVKRIKVKKALTALWIALAFTFSLTLFTLGLFNRVTMNTDGSIRCYNCFNAETEAYTVENIKEVAVSVSKTVNGGRNKTINYDIGIIVTANDGVVFHFMTENDFEDMIRLKNTVPKGKVKFRGKEHLADAIAYYDFDAENIKLLNELFKIPA